MHVDRTRVLSIHSTGAFAMSSERSATSRRAFVTRLGVGGISLGLLSQTVWEEELACASQNVRRPSSPSELKIVDLRVAVISVEGRRVPIIRIDTNQGISGYGEVRDGASKRYALFLKSRLLGENPCNVERLFKRIKQFGHHGREGGGVSGVEMALWDLAGKAFGVPVYQMLGGKYVDRIRLYADTPSVKDPEVCAQRLKQRVDMGFTYLKMDLGIGLIRDVPDALTLPLGFDWRTYENTMHPFTQIQITDKGVSLLADYVRAVRSRIGMEIPLAADHFGHIDVNSCIRLGRALQPLQMAWLEDMVPWQYTDMLKEITRSVDIPTLTGEDIFGVETFETLVNERAVDMIHPDLATAGGILETKRIGDYAERHGIPMVLHSAGSPVSFLAAIHCAAATENVVALEHHAADVPWWEELVTGIDKPLCTRGFAQVPNQPGLGFELNPDAVQSHLLEGEQLFAPSTEWDTEQSHDRLWS
jgi:L-alanine-DL-glutamate epimerase-like enolase superfamily enzyme